MQKLDNRFNGLPDFGKEKPLKRLDTYLVGAGLTRLQPGENEIGELLVTLRRGSFARSSFSLSDPR